MITDDYDEDFGEIYCEQCGKAIHNGDKYYLINFENTDHVVCIDCVIEYLDENCREVNAEGDDVYVVDDMEWYCEDDLNSLLKGCLRKHGEEDDI